MVANRTTPDMPLVYVSPGFSKLTGFSGGDALGKNCRFLQGSDTGQPGALVIRQRLALNLPGSCVLRNYRRDGSMFYCALSLFNATSNQGDFVIGVQQVHTIIGSTALQPALMDGALSDLHRAASHDHLTGLKNRQQLESRWQQLQRGYRHEASIVLFDLDRFKAINDQYGHLAGDEALKIVGEELKALANRCGVEVFRWGGDEFVVLLVGLQVRNAFGIASELQDAIKSREYYRSLGCSMGIARGHCDAHLQVLLQAADEALKSAKLSGRNRICMAQDNDTDQEEL